MNIIIIPGCDDTNRGDQALIWETSRLARDAGLCGDYYMISTEENSLQSKKEGIDKLSYILPHPSIHLKKINDNRQYTLKLKILWGIMALIDLAIALPIENKIFRSFFTRFLSDEMKETLKVFDNADFAIVKGGGFLHAGKGLSETYKIFYFLYHIRLAQKMNIPVLVMPNSYGSFGNCFQRYLVRKTLRQCVLVTSRETISHDVLMKECGIKSLVTMDLGAYLQVEPEFDPIKYLNEKNIILEKKKNVVITARPYRFPGANNPNHLYRKYILSLVELIRWLNANNYNVVLVEHVYSDNYHESDIKAIEDIEHIIKKDTRIKYSVISDKKLNCRQIKSIYSCFDYMVGTRFHSVIFSLFSDVPSIAITYGGNKGIGIMRDLGLEKYAIDISKVNKKCLIDSFILMDRNRNEYIEKIKYLKRNIEIQRNDLMKMIQDIVRSKNA